MTNTNVEIMEKVKEVLADYTDVEIEDIKEESSLIDDLDLSSFDFICLISSLEDEFKVIINEDILQNIKTVDDIFKVIKEYNKE